MLNGSFLRRLCAFLAASLFAVCLHAQSLSFSSGVQTYASLATTTVTLTGKTELRLTSGTSTLVGCTINLDSPDAWVLFTSVRPATVQSTYLSQFRVNGAAAVSGSNVRLVQYELGTMVVPHAPSFQPFQGFSGPNFSGSSLSLGTYTYYNTTGTLGVLNRAISSFRLKRGYMATLATAANGTGRSRVYIAQDGDLDIGRLPAELDNSVLFIRVLPWRWVSKKGSCDVAADTLNASWFYNWDNNQNSPLNWEYVPIRQQRYWPGLPTNKPDSTHLLGFNEPDNPVEDAYTSLDNGSVDTAIAVWPELLGSGLRVGAPAVTDGGTAWLYDFMDKAAAANLRVDYVPVHFYRCGYTAQQLYDWLKAIYDRTGKPLWVTEFNNGANWTGCADPSYASNATTISSFIDMMDNAPFVERYAVYSRVEYMRQMTYDEGGLTPAGVAYRDNASPMAYRQEIPYSGSRSFVRYTFNSSAADASGNANHALIASAPTFASSPRGGALNFDGSATHVQLPSDVPDTASFTFAAWIYWNAGANWQRIFDFGDDTSKYLFLTPSSGSNTLRFATRNNGSEQVVQTATPLVSNTWVHVAVTLGGGTARIYLNGTQAASGAVTITPAQITPVNNFLGRSQFAADPLFRGLMDEVLISDQALSAAQIAALAANTPPQFTSEIIPGGNAIQGQPYAFNLASYASDADAGDTLTFSKISGPTWLQVAADGSVTGTPTFNDSGSQECIVAVTDSAGITTGAVLTVSLPAIFGNGTWSSDADGSWNDAARWVSSFPANGAGFTATFNALNITADRTVTLDGSRTLGTLRFGDSLGAQNWTLAPVGNSALVLDTGTSTLPTLQVTQNTATLSVPIAGTAGFAKSGSGNLILSGPNTLSGTINLDTNSTTASDGSVQFAHPSALGTVSSINLRNNNSGTSLMALNGTAGNINSAASISLAGRTVTATALRNIAGTNTFTGGLTLQAGGSIYLIESEAGTLALNGPITSDATGARTLTFSGAGNFSLGGAITNGAATTGISLVKNGAGTLSLTGANTHTGTTTINGGAVTVSGSGVLGTGPITLASGSTLNLNRATTLAQSVSGAGDIFSNSGSTTLSGSWSTFTGSYTLNTGASSTAFNSVTSTSAAARYSIAVGTTTFQGLILGVASGTNTFSFGSLSGVTGSLLRNGLSVTANNTIQIGALNTNTEFAGVIGGGGGTLALTKVGTGRLVLSGASIYAGATAVNAGSLHVNGSIGAGIVTVQSGAVLGGTGTIGGTVNVLAGGRVEPGSNSIGTLTISGGVSLPATSELRIEIDALADISDRITCVGALTLAGNLTVQLTNGAHAAGKTYTLFTAGSVSGTFANVNLPALPSGLRWNTSAVSTGQLSVENAANLYEGWATTQGFASGEELPTLDPDGDALPNVLEWLLDSSPVSAASASKPTIEAREVPTSEWAGAVAGKRYLILSARVRKNVEGWVLFAQAGPTLDALAAPGSELPIHTYQAADEGDFEMRAWIHTTALEDTAGRAFIRLQAATP